MSKPKIKRLKPGEPLANLLPKLPPVNQRPFAYAIATLEHEADLWRHQRETDPEYADKTITDCETAVEVLLAERARRELLGKIFTQPTKEDEVLPSDV